MVIVSFSSSSSTSSRADLGLRMLSTRRFWDFSVLWMRLSIFLGKVPLTPTMKSPTRRISFW